MPEMPHCGGMAADDAKYAASLQPTDLHNEIAALTDRLVKTELERDAYRESAEKAGLAIHERRQQALLAERERDTACIARVNAIAERDAARAECESLRAQLGTYIEVFQRAYKATYQSHTGHWDRQGTRGANCPECRRAQEAREDCQNIIKAKLATPTSGESEVADDI